MFQQVRHVALLARRTCSGSTRLLSSIPPTQEEEYTRRGLYASLAAAGLVFLGSQAHLQCEESKNAKPSVVGRTHSPGLARESCKQTSMAAYEILLKSSKPTGATAEDEFNQKRLTAALHNLGLTVYSDISVQRIWKYFGSRVVSKAKFCEMVDKTPFLEAFVNMIIAREASLTFQLSKDYDFSKATTENYKNASMDFSGSLFAEERKGGEPPRYRDYGYHCNYSPERMAWQDSLVQMTVHRHNPQVRPWIVFSCGSMGVGKGYAFEYMSDGGYFPLEKIVRIDPDYFKSLMPEWDGYVKGGHDAGGMTHKESGFISELCQEAALQRRQNIWVDGSLRDGDWYAKVFADIRKRFPHYRIGIFNVHASKDVVLSRIKSRQEKTGRGVPDYLIEKSFNAPPHSLFTLGPQSDWIMRVDNETVPTLVQFSSIDLSGNWNQVTKRFAQISPAPHEFPHALAPLGAQVTDAEKMIKHLTRSDVHVGPSTLIAIANTSTGVKARARMGIPKHAQYLSHVWWDEDEDFPYGGFVFYDDHDHVLGGLHISGQDLDVDGNELMKTIDFRRQHSIDPDQLPESLKDPARWKAVTVPALLIGGATDVAFALPSELGGGLGAFVYKMREGEQYPYFPLRVPSSS